MSNEYKDWVADATDNEIITAYTRCIDNGWYREADLYKDELTKRGIEIL